MVASTIWPLSAVPTVVDSGRDSPVELGVRFKSDVNGLITGIRFYKASTNTGPHVGNLWSSTGTLLASATFSDETAAGWQQVNFAAPVAITANTVYVASYHVNSGHYSEDRNYFANSGVDNPPLHALRAGTNGYNGVFAYGPTSQFPDQDWDSSNYWVDVAFVPATVASSPVGISLNPSVVSLLVNATGSFTATVSNTSNTAVTWSATGGTITGTGSTVTYTAPATSGTYTVTATSAADPTKKASATVTVSAALTVAVAVSPTTASLTSNGTTSFTATVLNTSNTAVTWTTSGGAISGSGNTITYIAPSTAGTYAVTATSVADPSKQASATVNVTALPAPVSIAINPSTASLETSASTNFTASVSNTTNTAVTWKTTGGTVSGSSNTVTYTAPPSPGSYTLSATSVADPTKTATASVAVTAPPPTGPSAGFEGYGANVKGGAGQAVVTVTNLNDSGAGSLRAALGSNRTIRFSVAGTIHLSSPLVFKGANVTVDGFSAPSPGITVSSSGINDCFDIWGPGNNIVVQGLRLRDCGGDGFQIAQGAHDIVIDHNSISNSGDGNIDVTESSYNITLSWNINANVTAGSGGSLVKYDARQVSIHHNIYFNNQVNGRNPLLNGGGDCCTSGTTRDLGVIGDVRYNVVEDWGKFGTYFETDGVTKTYGNIVSNLYNGSSGYARNSIVLVQHNTSLTTAYVAGNVSIPNVTGCAYAYETCINVTDINQMNNHAEYATPKITGPGLGDNQGKVDTWTTVLHEAGVATHYPDDAADAGVRSGVTIPTLGIFSQPWN
jgi:hypothetical protein